MKSTYEVKKRYIGECGMAALWLKSPDGFEDIVAVEERVDVNSPIELSLNPRNHISGVSAIFPATSVGWGRAMSFVDEVV
jgi:hypothetical protein